MATTPATTPTTTTSSDTTVKLLDAQTALYNKQEAAYKAQLAAIQAASAEQSAALGTIAGSTAETGATTVGSNAGNAEASLLSAVELEGIAKEIVTHVKGILQGAKVLVVPGMQAPNVGDWWSFRDQMALVGDAFAQADFALSNADSAHQQLGDTAAAVGPKAEAVPLITGIGAALDLSSKLASYFQSDYQIQGSQVSGVDDDQLAVAVSGFLVRKAVPVVAPGLWFGSSPGSALFSLVKPLAVSASSAVARSATAQATALALRAAASVPDVTPDPTAARGVSDSKTSPDTDGPADEAPAVSPPPSGSPAATLDRAAFESVATAYDRAATAYDLAKKAYDAMSASLATADKDGIAAATRIIRQKQICDMAEQAKSFILFVRVNAAVGSNYAKKNLWTAVGGMPFFAMGGLVATFRLVDGPTGLVVGAGQCVRHAGYHKVTEIEARVNRLGHLPHLERDANGKVMATVKDGQRE